MQGESERKSHWVPWDFQLPDLRQPRLFHVLFHIIFHLLHVFFKILYF